MIDFGVHTLRILNSTIVHLQSNERFQKLPHPSSNISPPNCFLQVPSSGFLPQNGEESLGITIEKNKRGITRCHAK